MAGSVAKRPLQDVSNCPGFRRRVAVKAQGFVPLQRLPEHSREVLFSIRLREKKNARLEEAGTERGKAKIEQPARYSGDPSELQGFLTSCRSYFEYYSTKFESAEDKVTFAVSRLEGRARTWYYRINCASIPPCVNPRSRAYPSIVIHPPTLWRTALQFRHLTSVWIVILLSFFLRCFLL